MSTTYTWSIADLNRKTEDGYVFNVHWRLDASNGVYSEGAYGSVGLERPDTLIPFDSLTPETVIQWVKDHYGEEKVTEVEEALAARIAEKERPTQANGLPSSWAAE